MEEEIFAPPDSSGTFTEIPDDPIFAALKKPPTAPTAERSFREHELDIDLTDPRPEKVDVFTDPAERAERIRKQQSTSVTDRAASGAASTLAGGVGSVIDATIGRAAELTVVPAEANKLLGFVADVIAGNELPQERAMRDLGERAEEQNRDMWLDYLTSPHPGIEVTSQNPINIAAVRKAKQEAAEDASLFRAEEAYKEAQYAKIRADLERQRQERKKRDDEEKPYPCDYPWQVDRAGRKCGGRAAVVKKGGWPEGPRWKDRALPF